ncbi:hypothetical protein C0V97_01030 [Asaia sp. W19]|uniref:hypothetical protein n=1 Tax=unclassified Asaia TaxID=2685023 RepID=UPI000F8DF5DA|nr:hypothetical protein [Asaia sp. W19]RUT27383.1 hypothetical protein C0V97_01030 [Asaia sp. W19]
MTPQTPAGSVVQAVAAGAAAGAASSPILVLILLAFVLLAIGLSIAAVLMGFGNRGRIEEIERDHAERRAFENRTERAIETIARDLRNNTDLLHVMIRGHMDKKDIP